MTFIEHLSVALGKHYTVPYSLLDHEELSGALHFTKEAVEAHRDC